MASCLWKWFARITSFFVLLVQGCGRLAHEAPGDGRFDSAKDNLLVNASPLGI